MEERSLLDEPYRMTELGELPESWKVVRAVDVLNFERGTEPGSESYNKRGKGVRFIRVSDLSGIRDDIVYTTSQNVKLCKANDILISFDGSPGIVKKGLEGAYSSGIRKVEVKQEINLEGIKPEDINIDFIFYVLQSNYVQDTIKKYSTGVTIKHASKAIPNLYIPLPPLEEQKRIADILSAIDEHIEKAQNKRQALRELFKRLLKDLMTAKIRVKHINIED
jgi:type I restriction enzyme S subunit